MFLDEGSSEDDDNVKWMYSSGVSNPDSKELVNFKSELSNASVSGYKKGYSYQEWLDLIEEKHFDERDDLVRQTIQTALEDVDNPFSFLIHVMNRAFFDLYSKRPPITFCALDELDNWLKLKVLNKKTLPEPTESNKRMAAEFVCRSGYNYLDKLNSTFQLDNGDTSIVAEYVQLDNLKSKKLKETVTIIYTLKLQHHFNGEQIFLSLIANDQLQHVELYVGDELKLQKDYVCFLDKLCRMEPAEIIKLLIEFWLTCKDPSKLKHKTLSKIAEKAVKRYSLDPAEFPNIFGAKNVSALFYMIKMRLSEARTGSSRSKLMKWDDLIESAVSGKVWLQVKLVDRLIGLNEMDGAVYWTKRLSIPPQELPPVLLEEIGTSYFDSHPSNTVDGAASSQQGEPDGEDWESEIESDPGVAFTLGKGFREQEETTENFYKLKIPESSILLIDTVEKLEEMTKFMFQDGNIIGFDAEWKPLMCRAGEKEYMSILQLAIDDQVYILDLKVLYVTAGAEAALKTFLFQFFTKKSVTKVGYGITGDLKLLIGMFSYVKEFVLNAASLVDLFDLGKKILPHQQVQDELFNVENRGLVDKGLSMMVNRTLGKSLDKTFQVSDWERRPLKRDQLYYAALDAYCLLEVYERLCFFVEKYDLQLNTTEKVKTKWLKANKPTGGKRKDKYEGRENKEKVPIPENKPLFKGVPRPSTTLKVVCDTMLQGLGRQLRNCGVDTLILEDGQDHTMALQISHRDKRVILTRGKPFFMIRGYVGEDMVMWVPEGTAKEQVKMVFTRYHLAVMSKDILTRCVVCNSNIYSNIDSDEMQQTFELKYDVGDAEMPESQSTASKQINLVDFTLACNGCQLQLDSILGSRFERAMQDESWGKIFKTVKDFYVCRGCGKIYWAGSHHDAVKETFADLIDKRETDDSCYGRPG